MVLMIDDMAVYTVSESDEKEERPALGSIHEKLQIYKEKSQRESETGKDNRKRDFGLE